MVHTVKFVVKKKIPISSVHAKAASIGNFPEILFDKIRFVPTSRVVSTPSPIADEKKKYESNICCFENYIYAKFHQNRHIQMSRCSLISRRQLLRSFKLFVWGETETWIYSLFQLRHFKVYSNVIVNVV